MKADMAPLGLLGSFFALFFLFVGPLAELLADCVGCHVLFFRRDLWGCGAVPCGAHVKTSGCKIAGAKVVGEDSRKNKAQGDARSVRAAQPA